MISIWVSWRVWSRLPGPSLIRRGDYRSAQCAAPLKTNLPSTMVSQGHSASKRFRTAFS